MDQIFSKSTNFILNGFRLNENDFNAELVPFIQILNLRIFGRITNDNISLNDFKDFLIEFADDFPKFFYWANTLLDNSNVSLKDILKTTSVIIPNSLTKDKINLLYNFIETPPDPNLFEEDFGSTDEEL